MKFSPSQAHYALNVLLSQGKLRVAHIRKALKNREQEITLWEVEWQKASGSLPI